MALLKKKIAERGGSDRGSPALGRSAPLRARSTN
jgi:hypothetical protein